MSATDDRIAVIGIGCRFAGGIGSAEEFWRFLLDRRTAVGEVPADRWAAHRNRSREDRAALDRITRHGAFLDDIAGFDAAFFGISPREAEQLDPQQRVALEVAWEALEHAGIPPNALAGSDTAVFLGVGSDDYGRRLLEDLPHIQAWTGIGASPCGVANRISHVLDLRGASMAIDTACSSSLVALHQACLSLRAGETGLALAGGVMLMAGPGLTAVLDAAGAISPDGRSKAFDAAADGYGRGEGCGIVVLKRLADAQRDGDRVLALIRGSAVCQDGHTDGIMAPSRPAQVQLLHRAYTAAGVDPRTIGYVEAHGTGTRVGDPIEAAALAEVLGDRPPGQAPCLIGSVKTNIGHTEAAAGIAGLIKAVLAVRHGLIPATLTATGPRPDIPWAESGLRLVTEATPWPADTTPRRAGVGSYGYGGTIAHAVLEQAPPPAPEPSGATEHGRRLYPLSASTDDALRQQADRLADTLTATPAPALADTGHTLAHRRTHLRVRAVVAASSRDELVTGLRALATGRPETGDSVTTGTVLPDAGPVWVFSGHGAQWSGMGQDLLATEPVFAEVIDRLGPIYAEELGITPRQVLSSGDLGAVDRIQAMLFAMQVGLAALWRHHGVRPAAVIGHSVGEIAAAVVAGTLTEADGARLVCRRSTLLRRVAGQGAMIMVDLPFAQAEQELAGVAGVSAAIAASPTATVVAGDVDAVAETARRWQEHGRTVRRVDSDVAFHTEHMDPLARDLATAVADLVPRPATVPLYVTALDDPRRAPRQDAAYWATNLRAPVRFHDAVAAALDDGHRLFLEVSAHPVVAHSITETLAAHGITDGRVLPSLRRNRPEQATLLDTLATLHCLGVPVAWQVLQPAGRLVTLPGVAWRHRRYWVDGPAPDPDAAPDTLLGAGTTVSGSPTRIWLTTLADRTRPYPGHHPVLGTEIVPAAVLLATFLAAAGRRTDGAALADVRLHLPVVVPGDGEPERAVQVVRDGAMLRLCSRLPGDEWSTHCSATVADPDPDPADGPRVDDAWCDEPLEPGLVVTRLAELGVEAMGYPWRIDKLSSGRGALLASVCADPDGQLRHSSWAALLDAALSMASLIFPGRPRLRMPAALDRVSVTGAPPAQAVIAVHLDDHRQSTVDVELRATDGTVRAALTGLRYAEPDRRPDATAAPASTGDLLYELRWHDLPNQPSTDPADAASSIVVLGDAALARALERCASTATIRYADRHPAGAALADADHVLFAPPPTDDAHTTAAALTDTIRALANQPAGQQPRLWCLTRGLRDPDSTAALTQSPLWGISRVAATEHPEFWGGTLDLPPQPDETTHRELLRLLHHRPHQQPTDPVLAISPHGIQVPRLAPLPGRGPATPTCRPDGTYLITGGLGALGLRVARHLVHHGARRLVLLGRTALPPRPTWDAADHPPAVRARIDAVRALEATGASVFPTAADITDPAATRTALDNLALPPIRGVVHAAGTVHSVPLRTLDEDLLHEVMHAKVDGARVLHDLFPPGSLDFLVLFSSAGPLLGLPGQAAYAAANAFLDALATHRRGSGGQETVSVAWTSWRGLGMSTSAAATDVELAARGTADIDAEQALHAFDRVVADPARATSGVVAVLRVLPDHTGPRPALLSELADDQPTEPHTGARTWADLSTEDLASQLPDEVRRHVADVLGTDAAEIPDHHPLSELGVDSLLAALLRVRLEREFGIALAPTLLWNHPTLAQVSDYLAGQLASAPAREHTTGETTGGEPDER